MNKIRSYRDPLAPDTNVQIRDQWVSVGAYAEMVEKTIVSCTDAIVTLKGDDGAVYLGSRCVYPMKGVWCLGGRIFFNDVDLEASIARCVNIETQCRFADDRFEYLCTNLYSWVRTAQGEFPGKNLAPLYRLEVSTEELASMARGLKQSEYDHSFGLQRFDRQRLVDERVHPAMIDAFDLIFKT